MTETEVFKAICDMSEGFVATPATSMDLTNARFDAARGRTMLPALTLLLLSCP
jgi:hypothetical protein